MTTVANHELRSTLIGIVDEVARVYPLGEFELHLHSRGGGAGQCQKGGAVGMLAKLNEFCTQFPGALVRYTPNHPYGIISDIVCDCDGIQTTCPTKCRGMADRPRAFLLLIHDGVQAVVLGKYEPPKARGEGSRFRTWPLEC